MLQRGCVLLPHRSRRSSSQGTEWESSEGLARVSVALSSETLRRVGLGSSSPGPNWPSCFSSALKPSPTPSPSPIPTPDPSQGSVWVQQSTPTPNPNLPPTLPVRALRYEPGVTGRVRDRIGLGPLTTSLNKCVRGWVGVPFRKYPHPSTLSPQRGSNFA